jgi:hypothetical protein
VPSASISASRVERASAEVDRTTTDEERAPTTHDRVAPEFEPLRGGRRRSHWSKTASIAIRMATFSSQTG